MQQEEVNPRKLKALIFDFDGLILDTETPSYHAWAESYQEHGHELSLEVYTRCVGSDFQHYDPITELEKLTGRVLDRTQMNQKRRARIHELVETQPALPGVETMLQEAHALGLACAVASSSPAEWVEHWLGHLGFCGYFEHVVTLDDVSRPKPSPELFETAASRLGVGVDETVIFEDSLNGLRAAKAAGIPCVIVPNQVTRHLDFEGATMLIESMTHLSIDALDKHLSR